MDARDYEMAARYVSVGRARGIFVAARGTFLLAAVEHYCMAAVRVTHCSTQIGEPSITRPATTTRPMPGR